jgi:hypothetical protein
MFNDYDPYTELLRAQADIADLRVELNQLQGQLFQTVMNQKEILSTLDNQARAINSVYAIIKDHIETTYQPK